MPPACIQLYKVRKGASMAAPSATLWFQVQNTEDEFVASGLCEKTIPKTYMDVGLEEYTYEHVGAGVWEVEAHYNWQEDVFTFDTTGGTQKITQSRRTVASYTTPLFAAAPDYKGAIGVTADGIEGCDVAIPQFHFQLQSTLASTVVTPDYRVLVADLTGKVNNAGFANFQPGEVLFLGASGSRRGNSARWEINFKFARNKNAFGLHVGDVGTVVRDKVVLTGFVADQPVYLESTSGLATDAPGGTVNLPAGNAEFASHAGFRNVSTLREVNKIPNYGIAFALGQAVFLATDGLASDTPTDPRVLGRPCVAGGSADQASPADSATVIVSRVLEKASLEITLGRGQQVWTRPDGLATDLPLNPANPRLGRALAAALPGDPAVTVCTINKGGWEYLWIVYIQVPVKVGDLTFVVKQPVFAYVESVYESADLGVLGLSI